jgi:hypothetical protein
MLAPITTARWPMGDAVRDEVGEKGCGSDIVGTVENAAPPRWEELLPNHQPNQVPKTGAERRYRRAAPSSSQSRVTRRSSAVVSW